MPTRSYYAVELDNVSRACGFCGEHIWWGKLETVKRASFNEDGSLHLSSCAGYLELNKRARRAAFRL